jgi:hypothetical protein
LGKWEWREIGERKIGGRSAGDRREIGGQKIGRGEVQTLWA